MPVVPPYHLSKIWCLWSPLTIWAKFDACGPPLPFEQNLMPVVFPYHLNKIWCLKIKYNLMVKYNLMIKYNFPYHLNKIWCHYWVTVFRFLDSCCKKDWDLCIMRFKEQLYYYYYYYYSLSEIWWLWSPLTIWAKFDACGPTLPFGVTITQGYSLMIWCHKNARL